MIENVILVFHVLAAIAIIALILLQQGKGADAGASFGAGSSQTVFGAAGGGNALTRGTAILATAFFITSLSLAVFAKQKAGSLGQIDLPAAVETQTDVPAIDATSEIPAAAVAPEAAPAADVPAAEVPAASEEVPAAQ